MGRNGEREFMRDMEWHEFLHQLQSELHGMDGNRWGDMEIQILNSFRNWAIQKGFWQDRWLDADPDAEAGFFQCSNSILWRAFDFGFSQEENAEYGRRNPLGLHIYLGKLGLEISDSEAGLIILWAKKEHHFRQKSPINAGRFFMLDGDDNEFFSGEGFLAIPLI